MHACLLDICWGPVAEVKLGGRVNEDSAKKLLAKQLGEFASNMESVGFLEMKTGKINAKSRSMHLGFTCLIMVLRHDL